MSAAGLDAGSGLSLSELADRLGTTVIGDGSVRIHRLAAIRDAEPGDLTFLSNPRYAGWLESTRASAVIVGREAPAGSLPRLVADDPFLLFLHAVAILHPEEEHRAGRHATAVVATGARVDASATLGPGVVIEEGASIGERSVLLANAYVGREARIGAGCLLYPNAVVREECELGDRVILHAGAVIGADGFGYAFDGRAHRKVPQIGRVVLEDDVEIGANSTIDRATLGVTRIGRGTKIDNLVHIAHNVEIGEHSILCAQVGISGSARIGRFVIFAGQSGMVGHVEIGDGARIGAQGGVTRSVPPGETVSGYPAQNHTRASRAYAALRQLPEALRTLTRLERRVAELEGRKPDEMPARASTESTDEEEA